MNAKLTPEEIDAAASDWILRREAGLVPAAERELAAWLAADPRHATAFARHEQAWSLLDRPRANGRAAEMAGMLFARAARRRRRRVSAGAAAALLLLVAGVSWRTGWPTAHSSPAMSSSVVVMLPREQTLPDGTVVQLKAGAEIALAYTSERRGVTLRNGEALFQVTKDPSRPFVVTAGSVSVRAVGTAFLVQLGTAAVDVIVTEGQIAVERSASTTGKLSEAVTPAAESPPTIMVNAGKRVTVDLAPTKALPEPVTVPSLEIAERLAWRAPRLEFADAPLAEAVAAMNRHAKVRLVIDDPVLAKMPVNGIFRADNTDALIHLLEASFGVKVTRSVDTVVLRRATGE